MPSGYFHFGNNHFFHQLTFLKDILQMLADSRHSNSKELRYRFLRTPDSFIFYDDLYLTFFFRKIIKQKLYFICHGLSDIGIKSQAIKLSHNLCFQTMTFSKLFCKRSFVFIHARIKLLLSNIYIVNLDVEILPG